MANTLEQELTQKLKDVVQLAERCYVNHKFYIHKKGMLPKKLREIHSTIADIHTLSVKLDSEYNGQGKSRTGHTVPFDQRTT